MCIRDRFVIGGQPNQRAGKFVQLVVHRPHNTFDDARHRRRGLGDFVRENSKWPAILAARGNAAQPGFDGFAQDRFGRRFLVERGAHRPDSSVTDQTLQHLGV